MSLFGPVYFHARVTFPGSREIPRQNITIDVAYVYRNPRSEHSSAEARQESRVVRWSLSAKPRARRTQAHGEVAIVATPIPDEIAGASFQNNASAIRRTMQAAAGLCAAAVKYMVKNHGEHPPDRRKPPAGLVEKQTVILREPHLAAYLTARHDQLTAERRVLCFKAKRRIEWLDQDRKHKAKKRYHCVNLGESFTSSTQIRFSRHEGRDRSAAAPHAGSGLPLVSGKNGTSTKPRM